MDSFGFIHQVKLLPTKDSHICLLHLLILQGFVGEYSSNELDMSFELRLTDENKLKILFSNREREREVEALNRNELLASNFRMKAQRDQFDRVTDIFITLNEQSQK